MKSLNNSIVKLCLISVFILLILLVLIFGRKHYFNASTITLNNSSKINKVEYVDQKNSFNIEPKNKVKVTFGLIFYPGAFVDSKAYAPKLDTISNKVHLNIYIIKPPLRLANLNINLANNIIYNNPNIKHWFIGGHSMGGGAACTYSYNNPNKIEGLILLAAYCNTKAKQYSGSTLVFVGKNDPLEPLIKVKNNLPKKSKIVLLNGTNHASFGDYGKQPFDGQQSVSNKYISNILSNEIENFIKSN